MSSLSNRNVFQLPLNVQRTPVVLHGGEASNAPVLSDSQAEVPSSLRFASNPALAHLKALGSRLTSAQRKSISLLQQYESAHGFACDTPAQLETAEVKSLPSHSQCALQRRATFKLV